MTDKNFIVFNDPPKPLSEVDLAIALVTCPACEAKPTEQCYPSPFNDPHISRVDVLRSLRIYMKRYING
jgi:hypothetical protein